MKVDKRIPFLLPVKCWEGVTDFQANQTIDLRLQAFQATIIEASTMLLSGTKATNIVL